MRAVQHMQSGGVLAHQTGTVAGVAALPHKRIAVRRLQRFKQRQAPFLVLVDTVARALAQARYIPKRLRVMAKQVWPGSVTLVFPVRHGVGDVCHASGWIAVRVDADEACRDLVKRAGGLLLSSSLNRKGKQTMCLSEVPRFRYRRYGLRVLSASSKSGSMQPSRMYRIAPQSVQRLR